MTLDELRAKFEITISSFDPAEFHSCFSLVRDNNGNYKDDLVMAMWNGYRLGRDSRDAEVEALRKDAERYRWLRENGDQMIGRDRGEGPEWTYWDELDQAIDAAMREESK